MALVKGLNSFVTLNEADSYLEDRADVLAWDEADDCLKEKCIITATTLLDELPFQGAVVDADQNLAFPRSGFFRDQSRGVRISYSTYTFTDDLDEDEEDLKRDLRLLRRATYELAYHLCNNAGLLDRTGSVTDIKVGPISLTEVQDASVFPRHIRKIVEPMLRNGGTKYWRGW
jgi:hypothetical protein